jgi:chemotaxis protein histidine kinase CheA/ActR/RegA family two-component response regulator
MASGLDDLLPLFLAEAKDRLEKLSFLLGGASVDREEGLEIRRELHALKGASRMMKLTELSEMCHRAEEIFQPGAREHLDEVITIVDQIAQTVEDLTGQSSVGGSKEYEITSQVAGVVASSKPSRERRSASAGQQDDLRVPSAVVERLADRAARLRIMSMAAGRLVEQSFRLSQLAERGAREAAPEQVLATLATTLRQLSFSLEGGQREVEVLADRQLDALLRLQVQPLRPFLLGLARHGRELASSLGKQVEVRVSVQKAALDRRILRTLEDVFVHLVRNAIDHGIETPKDRAAAGKQVKGQVLIEAEGMGAHVRLTVRDDGQGIDAGQVVRKAVEAGLVSDEEVLSWSDEQKLRLVLRSGFTTRDETTEVSGRGIGLDAVSERVHAAGGTLRIESARGRGTAIKVTVPVSRRGERVMIAEVGDCRIGIPAAIVRSLHRVDPMTVEQNESGKVVAEVFEMGRVDVCLLASMTEAEQATEVTLLNCRFRDQSLQILVNAVIAEEEVFVRPVPPILGVPKCVEGLATLASGRPLPVLSPRHLLRDAGSFISDERDRFRSRSMNVLLVDDSAVTREMIRRILEGGGITVVSAANGQEAVDILASSNFDCVVTDIEMPLLDGLELTRHIRGTEEKKHLPVIVISTRNRPEDRLAGLDAGADAYLVKQNLDARELIALVKRVGVGT